MLRRLQGAIKEKPQSPYGQGLGPPVLAPALAVVLVPSRHWIALAALQIYTLDWTLAILMRCKSSRVAWDEVARARRFQVGTQQSKLDRVPQDLVSKKGMLSRKAFYQEQLT